MKNKKEDIKINKKENKEKVRNSKEPNKEIMITIIVLLGTIVVGISLGKVLFDAFRARMGI